MEPFISGVLPNTMNTVAQFFPTAENIFNKILIKTFFFHWIRRDWKMHIIWPIIFLQNVSSIIFLQNVSSIIFLQKVSSGKEDYHITSKYQAILGIKIKWLSIPLRLQMPQGVFPPI